jgi:iron(III) transport system ATP-binding protein
MIRVVNLHKEFSTRQGTHAAVRGVDFEVKEGEIFMLLGPSGCGKTTTLRCIAGLEVPDDGEIWIDDQLVFANRGQTLVPVYRRGVGMVFQSYAVWPHLTVFQNVAYPLVYGINKIPRRQVRERVRKALALVGLNEFEDRSAPLLSGGQQQRVSLARALVYEPKVLLLDEPLSNLDAKLRAEMRVELRALMKRLKITAVYVTHDQEEALVLSDRVAVMHAGQIKQMGTPRDIYVSPKSDVVAGFIGMANLLQAKVERLSVEGEDGIVDSALGKLKCDLPVSLSVGETVTVMFRPEDVLIGDAAERSGDNVFPATVKEAMFVGSRFQCQISVNAQRIHAEISKSRVVEAGQRVMVEIPPHVIRLLL